MLKILTLLCAILFSTAGLQAAMISLEGQGSSSGAPLVALVNFDLVSDHALTVTITNDADEGGAGNRITYFGIQIPNVNVSAAVDNDASDGKWKVLTNTQVPGQGANTFNWVFQENDDGPTAGLNLGEQLVIHFTSPAPLFSGFTLDSLPPTSKNGYILAAKFQTVGDDGEDSGVATTINTPPDDQDSPEVPEPASMGIFAAGLLMILGSPRRWFNRRQGCR